MMEQSNNNPLKTYTHKEEPAGTAPLDLNGLVRKAVSLLEYQMRVRNIPITVNLAREPLFVKGDFHLLLQALLHVLLGIIKSFETHKGERCVVLSTEKDAGKAVLDLRDSIRESPEETADIFRSHDIPGKMRGLGTPLAHRIIKIHGGEMALSHTENGRRFRIELPLVRPRPEKREGRSYRILVVDDDAIVVDVFKEFLTLLGHDARVMSSPLKALEVLAEEKFDFVLVDLRMPEMDGMTFIEKAERYIDRKRLWLLTGDIMSFEVDMVKKRGDIRILEKPVSIERFKTLFDSFPGEDE